MTISNRFNIPLVGDGQLLIGSTGVEIPTAANLTAGAGISITNGPGSISIANTVPTPKVKYYASSTPNRTITSPGALVTLVLPANTATVNGDLIEIGGEIVVTGTGGAIGNLNLVTGSSTTVVYNSFNVAAGVSATYSFYGFIIRSSSNNGFLANQCTGIKSTGTNQADAHILTTASINFSSNANMGTSLNIFVGTASVTQRMLWIRVTGA